MNGAKAQMRDFQRRVWFVGVIAVLVEYYILISKMPPDELSHNLLWALVFPVVWALSSLPTFPLWRRYPRFYVSMVCARASAAVINAICFLLYGISDGFPVTIGGVLAIQLALLIALGRFPPFRRMDAQNTPQNGPNCPKLPR